LDFLKVLMLEVEALMLQQATQWHTQAVAWLMPVLEWEICLAVDTVEVGVMAVDGVMDGEVMEVGVVEVTAVETEVMIILAEEFGGAAAMTGTEAEEEEAETAGDVEASAEAGEAGLLKEATTTMEWADKFNITEEREQSLPGC
jgi:hypothetical protein